MSERPLGALLRQRAQQAAAGLLIGVLALLFSLWGVPLSDVGAALRSASMAPLLMVAALFLVQQTIRALRQALILQATRPSHAFRVSLSVLCVSFLLINTLPARIGELSRPLLLLERDGTPLGVGFAAVVLERMLDLMATFMMLALVAWFVPVESRTITLGEQEVNWVSLGQQASSVVLPLIVALFLILFFAGRAVLQLIRSMTGTESTLRGRLMRPVLRFGETFIEAVEAVRSPARLSAIVALTATTWGLTGLMYPHLAEAFGVGELIGYGEGIGVLCITMLGMIVPSAPGFAGTYEAFCKAGLGLFGVSGPELDGTAFAMALTFHWWIFVVQALTAIYFLFIDRISLRRLLSRLHEAAQAPATQPTP